MRERIATASVDTVERRHDKGHFDAMSEPIAQHGGEILKFIGDGLLAIFPLSQPHACENLLQAVSEARQAMSP